MKLTLLLSTVLAINTMGSVYSQNARFSLDIKDKPVREIFQIIEQQSKFRFFYNDEFNYIDKEVSISIKDANVEEILQVLFASSDITYRILDNNLVVLTLKQSLQQKVTGQVTDASTGEPLPGVNVLIEGTTTGVTTDVNGKFVIDIPGENSVIVFSYLGYLQEKVKFSGQTVIDIKLAQDIKQLGEVIITALGVKREEKALGYAVQKVSGDVLTTVKGVDIGTSLTGKAAGLLVKNSTEFTAAPTIQLRGETPLLVVDGVPYGNLTLRDISSDDIESISILKGATASALYGYRGGSGAIMITTKKGSAHQGLAVTINSSTMFNSGFLAIPRKQAVYGRGSGGNYGFDGNWGPAMDGTERLQWDPISKTKKMMPYLPVGKDNFKNFLEPGYISNNNISVVQQGQNSSFRSSFTWVNNKGQYPNSMFNRYNASIGGDMKVKKFTLSSNFSYSKDYSPNIGYNGYKDYGYFYSMLIWAPADWDVRQYKDYWVIKDQKQNSSFDRTHNNPYFQAYERTKSLDNDIFNGSLALAFDITPWMKLSLRSGVDSYKNRQDQKVSIGSYQSNVGEFWEGTMVGSFATIRTTGYSLNNDVILTGNRTFGKFGIDGLFGGTLYYKQDENLRATTKGGLSIPGFYSLKASVNPAYVASWVSEQQVNSLYGRVALSWNNMLYLEGTGRNDWSSTMPVSTRSYFYPSVASSFIVSELLPEVSWLSMWKLRGSWTVSKTPADIYEINSVYNVTNSAWGTLTSASLPTTVRGADVRPQSASSYEVGSYFNLWKNRVSLDVTYYAKRMYDFITATGVSSTTGYSSRLINLDEEITRRGVEIAAGFAPVRTKNWEWNVNLNWSKYARYYTKLDSMFSSKMPWVRVGQRADAYIVNDNVKDPSGNLVFNSAGLPITSPYKSRIGYSDPNWIWGIGSTLRYKNLTLNIGLDGRAGGLIYSVTEGMMWYSGSHPNSITPERALDVANLGTKNYVGKGVKVVSGTVTYDTYGNITSDTRVFAPNDVTTTYESYIKALHRNNVWGSVSPLDVLDGTFLKIREISISYDLPAKISGKIGSKGISVALVGQNMYLWAKRFKYSDPDGGTEDLSAPSQRYMGFNVKLNF